MVLILFCVWFFSNNSLCLGKTTTAWDKYTASSMYGLNHNIQEYVSKDMTQMFLSFIIQTHLNGSTWQQTRLWPDMIVNTLGRGPMSRVRPLAAPFKVTAYTTPIDASIRTAESAKRTCPPALRHGLANLRQCTRKPTDRTQWHRTNPHPAWRKIAVLQGCFHTLSVSRKHPEDTVGRGQRGKAITIYIYTHLCVCV